MRFKLHWKFNKLYNIINDRAVYRKISNQKSIFRIMEGQNDQFGFGQQYDEHQLIKFKVCEVFSNI